MKCPECRKGNLIDSDEGTICGECGYYQCVYGLCKHDPEQHKDGNCWVVTQPDKTGSDIFCKCSSQDGHNLRLYKNLGYVEIGDIDFMTTKKCKKCRKDVLLRRGEDLCETCRPETQKVLTEIPEYIIRRPISQVELQAVL